MKSTFCRHLLWKTLLQGQSDIRVETTFFHLKKSFLRFTKQVICLTVGSFPQHFCRKSTRTNNEADIKGIFLIELNSSGIDDRTIIGWSATDRDRQRLEYRWYYGTTVQARGGGVQFAERSLFDRRPVTEAHAIRLLPGELRDSSTGRHIVNRFTTVFLGIQYLEKKKFLTIVNFSNAVHMLFNLTFFVISCV